MKRVPGLCHLVAAILVCGLTACANLDAVRDFGTSAATISAYPDGAKAYRDSAVTAEAFSSIPASPGASATDRDAQVKAVLALEGSVASYFATLAKLSGADTFSLDKQIGAVQNNLDAVPVGTLGSTTTVAEVSTGIDLAKLVAKYAALAAQQGAVRQLIQDGGPSAMKLLDNLAAINGDWAREVEQDWKGIDDELEIYGRAKDVNAPLRVLLKDRQAQLAREYAARKELFETIGAALSSIKTAHSQMAAQLDSLTGPELREQLVAAIADLQDARTKLESLR